MHAVWGERASLSAQAGLRSLWRHVPHAKGALHRRPIALMLQVGATVVNGSAVSLTADYAAFSNATGGPLQPGDVGKVVQTHVSGERFKVKALSGDGMGKEWWYDKGAVAIAAKACAWKWLRPCGGVRECVRLLRLRCAVRGGLQCASVQPG